MANPTVPDFTGVAARKLAELQANGYRITGYCFERQVEGTQPQRGFVDFAGFVGWWKHAVVPLSDWDMRGQLAASLHCWHRLTPNEAAELVAFVKRITAHGVADMKGGQDVAE